MQKTNLKIILAVAFLGVGYSGSANAYLDPGTGSILLQGLIAAIVGATFTLKLYWSKVKEIMGGVFSGKKLTPTTNEDNQDQT